MKVRRYQDRRIDSLTRKLEKMSHLVNDQLQQSLAILIHHRKEEVKQLVAQDEPINELKEQIEWEIFNLIMFQQPLSSELVYFIQLLRAARELERIGDLSCNMAESTLFMKEGEVKHDQREPLLKMVELINEMVTNSVQGLCTDDTVLMTKVIKMDDQVDDYFHNSFEQFIEGMSKGHHPIYDTSQLLLVLRYLERIADHAVNIAQWKPKIGDTL